MIKVDIIICTYNRPGKVIELINQLCVYSSEYTSLIVVDSSDVINPLLKTHKQILYKSSSYKNQPYQRYLGYANSKADIIIFLDDDMEVANPDFLKIIKCSFQDTKVSGLAINFKDKHPDTALAVIPKSILFKKMNGLKRIIGWLSGYPVLPAGKFGLCGLRGEQPVCGGITEWLSGGAFAALRSSLFQNFNFQLFDLFEQNTGMGEDIIIGYGLSKQGTLLYNQNLLFYHNDQKDSAYSVDHYAYARRVIFSRLYLSLEKIRLDGGNTLYAYLHFHWYFLWRIAGLCLNYLIKKKEIQYNLFKGSCEGWKLALKFKFDKDLKSLEKWQILPENITS